MKLRGRHLYYSVCIWSDSLLTACSQHMLAICASLILFATFIVGLRCFGDFDKGLKPSKVHGQSLLPTQSAEKINLIGEYSSSSPAHRRQFNTQLTRVQYRGQARRGLYWRSTIIIKDFYRVNKSRQLAFGGFASAVV